MSRQVCSEKDFVTWVQRRYPFFSELLLGGVPHTAHHVSCHFPDEPNWSNVEENFSGWRESDNFNTNAILLSLCHFPENYCCCNSLGRQDWPFLSSFPRMMSTSLFQPVLSRARSQWKNNSSVANSKTKPCICISKNQPDNHLKRIILNRIVMLKKIPPSYHMMYKARII